MNTIDIILLLFLIPALISGIKKGLISQIISLIAIVLGVWLSYRFAGPVGEWVESWLAASPAGIRIVTFLIIFIAVGIGLMLLGKLLEGVLKLAMLGWLNRFLGVAFAIFKYLIVAGVMIAAFDGLNAKAELVSDETLAASHLYSLVKNAALLVFPYLKHLVLGA